MDRLAAGTLGMGIVLIANPLYHGFIRETVGFLYAGHSLVTSAGLLYILVGVSVLILSYREVAGTTLWAVAITLLGLAVIGGFHLLVSKPEFGSWIPWFGALAAMVSLGAGTRNQRIGIVVGIGGALAVIPFRLSISPTAWNGPVILLIWFVLGWIWVAIAGSPLYLIGKRTFRQVQDSGETRWLPSVLRPG
jgi:hypothetical protein